MAHDHDKRGKLRGLYCYQRMTMDAACAQVGIGRTTATRWRKEALANGDDWEVVRSATALGDESMAQLSRKLLEDYLIQHQTCIEQLRNPPADAPPMGPMQRAEALSRLSDSFNKTMSSFKRLSPELNRQSIALDTVQRFATFAQQRYPKHLAALLEMLEPFGEELAKAYN